jgi:hypothetical protein
VPQPRQLPQRQVQAVHRVARCIGVDVQRIARRPCPLLHPVAQARQIAEHRCNGVREGVGLGRGDFG